MNNIPTKDSSINLYSQLIMAGNRIAPSKTTKVAFEDKSELQKQATQRIVDRISDTLWFWFWVGASMFLWWAFWYYFSFVERRRRSFANW